jgi:hypothetical protein
MSLLLLLGVVGSHWHVLLRSVVQVGPRGSSEFFLVGRGAWPEWGLALAPGGKAEGAQPVSGVCTGNSWLSHRALRVHLKPIASTVASECSAPWV